MPDGSFSVWTPPAALARWVEEWTPPSEPFALWPHLIVTAPALFAAVLRRDLQRTPPPGTRRDLVRRSALAKARRLYAMFGRTAEQPTS